MPTLDASRVSPRDEPVVCVLLAGDHTRTLVAGRVSRGDEPVVCVLLAGCGAPGRANGVSIPAVRHRRDAIRTRRLKKVRVLIASLLCLTAGMLTLFAFAGAPQP